VASKEGSHPEKYIYNMLSREDNAEEEITHPLLNYINVL
jgi:hypothetical protein